MFTLPFVLINWAGDGAVPVRLTDVPKPGSKDTPSIPEIVVPAPTVMPADPFNVTVVLAVYVLPPLSAIAPAVEFREMELSEVMLVLVTLNPFDPLRLIEPPVPEESLLVAPGLAPMLSEPP